LTSSRKPWYSIENRKPAPILVTVFNREGVKFIRNETEAINLTTFHCVYPIKDNLFTQDSCDFLFAYLISNVAQEIFEDNRREYGNGLKKFEPNDVNKALMMDINTVPDSIKNKILTLYREYRTLILTEQNADSVLNNINNIFKIQFEK
jgi:adenine-specific DNA-methyltransferase